MNYVSRVVLRNRSCTVMTLCLPCGQTHVEGRQEGRRDLRGAGRGAGQDLHGAQAGTADRHDDFLPQLLHHLPGQFHRPAILSLVLL